MNTTLLSSASVPSLASLDTRSAPSSSSPSSSPAPFLPYSSSLSSIPDSPPPSPSPSPSRSIVYIQTGQTSSTGILASLHSLYFILSSSRALPDASTSTQSVAILSYRSSSSLRLTLDPSLFFFSSPSSHLDFSICAISHSSYTQLESQDRLDDALDLTTYITKDSLHRHQSLTILQHPTHSPLSTHPGYVLSLFSDWLSYNAPCHAGTTGGLICTADGDVVGLHRGRNDSRRWCEGTLMEDVVSTISPYLQSVKSQAANGWRLWRSAPPSPERRGRSLTPPASPKGEALVLASGGRVDVWALLCMMMFVLYGVWEWKMESVSGGNGGSKWLRNGMGLAVIAIAQFMAYLGYRRWKTG